MKNFIFKQALFLILTMSTYTGSAQFDYEDALAKSIYFFDANKSGPDVAEDNRYSWRGPCHLEDGSIVGYDLTGGFHHGGDHLKIGLPQAWSASTIGFALYEFKDSFVESGTTTEILKVLKYFTDYFLRSHPTVDTYYYDIGNLNEDHMYWGPPETQTGERPVMVADDTTPGSDICGQTAAALALMYLNYNEIDADYANQCLQAAIEIYDIGRNNLGKTDNPNIPSYISNSYYDDLTWGAIWLSIATGDNSYLDPVEAWLEIPGEFGFNAYTYEWAPVWDNSYLYALAKLHDLTGIDKYRNAVLANLDWFLNDNYITPGGIPWLSPFGPLRYVASEAGLGFLAAKFFNYTDYVQIGSTHIDYILGDNPRASSYITGWGNNPPKYPHHRANQPDITSSFTNGMVGALVGGPDRNDMFNDDVSDFMQSDVSIDFNAALVLGLAGRIYASKLPINVPPTVEFLEPDSGEIVVVGSPVNLSVIATDSDGAIDIVRYWVNDELQGASIVEPYSVQWIPRVAGEYQIRAEAIDDESASTSTTITVIVREACDFGTPSISSLPTTGHRSYKNIYVLGNGGPNLDNVVDFVINWNLENNGLYQFSMFTSDGIPAWWNDFIPRSDHNFNETGSLVTLSDTGFANLNGSYYATMDGDNFVLVSTSDPYTIYFSNSEITPECRGSKSLKPSIVSNDILSFPNPVKSVLTIQNIENFNKIIVLDMLGREIMSQENNGESKIQLHFEEQKAGVYIVKCIKENGDSLKSLIVRE